MSAFTKWMDHVDKFKTVDKTLLIFTSMKSLLHANIISAVSELQHSTVLLAK
jgi:hypothetical protein